MAIETSGSTLTISFVRRGLEKWSTVFIAFTAIASILIALGINVFPQMTELLCDRGKDACTLRGADITGGSWSVAFPVSAMRRSRIERDGGDDPKWMLDMASRPSLQLGNPTGRTVQQDDYATYASALQSFIDDETQGDFAARFASIGGPSPLIWMLVSLALIGTALGLVHGWRTQIILDKAAGKLGILRAPSLFGPARQSLALAKVKGAGSRKGGFLLLFSYVPTVKFQILGQGGRMLVSRSMLANRRNTEDTRAAIEAMNAFMRDTGTPVPPARK
jgi:hypothetical protein